jgi:hypothetical protein
MDIIPMRPVMPFHRMKDSKAREGHEVAMMLPVQEEVGFSSVEMGKQFALLQMVLVCSSITDIDVWGQVDVLRMLLRYAKTMLSKPVPASEKQEEDVDKDLKLLLTCAEPLFTNKNPAVRTLIHFYHENLVDLAIRLCLLSHGHSTTLLLRRCSQKLARLSFASSTYHARLSVWHWLTCSS